MVEVKEQQIMEIKLKRIADNGDASISLFYIDDEFQCFVIEDEHRTKKVYGETRIPEGIYNMDLRREGGFHARYSKKFSDHKGMLCLYNKPNWTLENAGMSFQYILIHTGNTDEHTSGCLSVGDTQQDLDVNFNGMVGSSKNAYVKLYDKVAKQLLIGNQVTIEYSKIQLEPQEPNDVYEKLQEINGNVLQTNAMLKGRVIQ